MRSGKDEEKNTGPLFPRLHVNDTEKGGPRAPPRNKMALYEQLSIPSQRFNSGSASTLPVPQSNNSSMISASSASLSQGGGNERTLYSPYRIPPSPVHPSDEFNSRSSDGVNFKTTTPDFEHKRANYQTSNPVGQHLSSNAERSSFRTPYFPNATTSYPKKVGDEDDFMVPTFPQPGSSSCTSKEQIPAPCNNMSRVESGIRTSPHLHNARDNHLKQPTSNDLRSSQIVRNQEGENWRESLTRTDYPEKTPFYPSTGEKTAEPRQNNKLDKVNSQLYSENIPAFLPEKNNRSDGVSNGPRSSPRAFPGNGLRTPNKYYEDNTHRASQVEELDRNDDVSETSILDSVSSLDISPDDVVGVIGQKQFWKARKAIANQQRVFSVQVFELHRLIKVQKLFAGSPNLLLEDSPYLTQPSLKEPPLIKLPSKFVVKSLPEPIKQRDVSSKPNRSSDFTAENAVEKPSLPSLSDNEIERRIINPHSTYGPSYSENLHSTPPPNNDKPGWCYHPQPGNQWLVPVMSPSEGLIYKPYSGPCPPSPGYMTPFYGGGCAPMSLPPMSRDYLNPGYRFPAPHQQQMGHHSPIPVTPNYFPPFGMPVMNTGISASGIEQVNPMTQQLSTGDFNVNMHSRNSCNMSKNQKSEAISRRISKFPTSKESEFQGSTASSPAEKVNGVAARAGNVSQSMDALPLFPMAPVVQDQDGDLQVNNAEKQNTRVIKVIPHNPRSANESAARIFRSIQEERQQFEST